MSRNSHRRIIRNTQIERACVLIAAMLRRAALLAVENNDISQAFVSRRAIEDMLLNSKYKSTAISKCMSYVDDIITYHGGELIYKRNGKRVEYVRLVNYDRFTDAGFGIRNDEDAQQIVLDDANTTQSESATMTQTDNAMKSSLILADDSFNFSNKKNRDMTHDQRMSLIAA